MKNLNLSFLFIITILFSYSSGFSENITVGVLYFENNSLVEKEKYDGLRKGLCDIMITELRKIPGLSVVERSRLEDIMSEIALGQTGMTDKTSAPQVGKLLGAQYMLLGSFLKAPGGNDIRIDIRIVNVENGKIVKAEEVSGDADRMLRLINKLSFKIAAQFDISLSRKEKRSIEPNDNINMNTLLLFSEGLELAEQNPREAVKKLRQVLEDAPGFTRAARLIEIIEKEPE